MSLNKDELNIKNTINLYDTVTAAQLEILCELNSETKRRIIESLVSKNAIKKDIIEGGIDVYCNFYNNPNKKYLLVAEVLSKMKKENNTSILWYQKQEYPFTGIGFINNKIFDIAVVQVGEEVVFKTIINRILQNEKETYNDAHYITAPAQRENFLIIVEDKEQIDKISVNHDNVIYVFVNIENNIVELIKKD